MAFTARVKDLMKKYGKVALGVHMSVSAASITGLYVAIDNNVDVDGILRRVGISPSVSGDAPPPVAPGDDASPSGVPTVVVGQEEAPPPQRNRTGELVASSGGALALALICNKALIPVRVPITVALTPPIAKLLARWKLVKSLKT